MTSNNSSNIQRVSLLLTLPHQVGELERVLSLFKKLDISLTSIESRPSKTSSWNYDFSRNPIPKRTSF
jgi:prephenate dehydratase